MERFAAVNETDLDNLLESKDSENTKKIVKRSVIMFREFLGHESCDFESFSKENLDQKLKLLFASVRTKNGQSYLKVSTLHSIKYGLFKFIKDVMKIDVQNDPEFSSSKIMFKAVITDLKKKGYGGTEHKPPISGEDLQLLYKSDVFNIDTTHGLQKKVWFDLVLYLCRRGRENLREMTKNTFEISKDAQGLEYVFQTHDEMDKNHG